jgi:hypothetical protein
MNQFMERNKQIFYIKMQIIYWNDLLEIVLLRVNLIFSSLIKIEKQDGFQKILKETAEQLKHHG